MDAILQSHFTEYPDVGHRRAVRWLIGERPRSAPIASVAPLFPRVGSPRRAVTKRVPRRWRAGWF
jgi:hypothetical protein